MEHGALRPASWNNPVSDVHTASQRAAAEIARGACVRERLVGLGGVQTVCVAGAVPGTFLPTYLRRRWLGTGAQSPGR